MKIINVYEQDYTYSKLDTGWRIQIDSGATGKWRNVLSDGSQHWVMVYGKKITIDPNGFRLAKAQYAAALLRQQGRVA